MAHTHRKRLKRKKKIEMLQISMYFGALGFVEQSFFPLSSTSCLEMSLLSLIRVTPTQSHKHTHPMSYVIPGWLYLGALSAPQQRAGPFAKLRRTTYLQYIKGIIRSFTRTVIHTRKQSPFCTPLLSSPAKRQSESIPGSLHAFALSYQPTELNHRERGWDVNYTASPVKVT